MSCFLLQLLPNGEITNNGRKQRNICGIKHNSYKRPCVPCDLYNRDRNERDILRRSSVGPLYSVLPSVRAKHSAENVLSIPPDTS